MDIGDIITDEDQNQYEVLGKLGDGGQATVYRVSCIKGPYQEELAVKIYKKKQKNLARLEEIIKSTSFVQKLPELQICVPLRIINNKKQGLVSSLAIGKMMEGEDFFMPPISQTEAGSFEIIEGLLDNKFSYKSFVLGAYHLTRTINILHNNGLVHCDLSLANVFFDTNNGRISLIDCDNMVCPNYLDSTVKGTPGFMAPELHEVSGIKPSKETERHALAVLIFYFLLLRHPLLDDDKNPSFVKNNDDYIKFFGSKAIFTEHRSNNSCRFTNPDSIPFQALPQALKDLFYRSFEDGLTNPDVRPQAREWKKPLWNAVDSLYICEHCERANFATSIKCIFCEEERTEPLYRLKFNHGFEKIVYPGAQLFDHHCLGKDYHFDKTLVDFKWHANGKFVLANRSYLQIEAEKSNGKRSTCKIKQGFALDNTRRIIFEGKTVAEVERLV